MMRSTIIALLFCTAAQGTIHGQQDPVVRRAQQAYDELDFAAAITSARRALQRRLNQSDRIVASEVLAFSYATLDSAAQAIDAFKQLIFLSPNRDPDVDIVSPRITSLYASALGQVLVVRKLSLDSTSFVAGQDGFPVAFEVSRPARVRLRVVGEGFDAVVDSQLVSRRADLEWSALDGNGSAVAPGNYQMIVTAVEGRNEFDEAVDLVVFHLAVDTLPHLTSLPGYTELPERERPPPNWRPLGIALLYAGLGVGAALAMENDALGGAPGPIAGVGGAALVAGFIMSIRKPDLQLVGANVRFNELLEQQLQERNTEIALDNEQRRLQTRVVIVPAPTGTP